MNLGLLLILSCVGFGVHVANGQMPLVEHAQGECKPYPADGYCAEYGMSNVNVFLWENTTFEELGEKLALDMDQVKRAAQTLASPECYTGFLMQVCLTWFPPCDSEHNRPKRPCKSNCEKLENEICPNTYAVARSAGMGKHIPSCDNVIGDSASGYNWMFVHYLQGWSGESVFVSETYEDTGLGTPVELECAGLDPEQVSMSCAPQVCPEPMIEQRYPIPIDGNEGLSTEFQNEDDWDFCRNNLEFNCSRCISVCEHTCPLSTEAFYPPEDLNTLNVMQYIPGLIATPFTLLVCSSEYKRVKNMRKKDFTDWMVFICGIFSLGVILLDSLPALVMRSDIQCGGHPTFSMFKHLSGTPWCNFAKVYVHFNQALMLVVCCTLYKVRKQLIASQNMSRYQPSNATKWVFKILIFVLPLVLAVCSFLLQVDPLYERNSKYRQQKGGEALEPLLYIPNNIRNMFTCRYRFKDDTTEYVLIQGPLLVAGGFAALLAISLVLIVSKMHFSARTKSSSSSSNKTIVSLAVTMTRFALVAFILVLFNATATFMYLPHAMDFGTKLTKWNMCAVSGVNFDRMTDPNAPIEVNSNKTLEANLEWCGSLKDKLPSITQLSFLAMSSSILPLGFSLVFVIPALKQRYSKITSHLTRTGTASVAPATSAVSSAR